jgi:hypothetical protein
MNSIKKKIVLTANCKMWCPAGQKMLLANWLGFSRNKIKILSIGRYQQDI